MEGMVFASGNDREMVTARRAPSFSVLQAGRVRTRAMVCIMCGACDQGPSTSSRSWLLCPLPLRYSRGSLRGRAVAGQSSRADKEDAYEPWPRAGSPALSVLGKLDAAAQLARRPTPAGLVTHVFASKGCARLALSPLARPAFTRSARAPLPLHQALTQCSP